MSRQDNPFTMFSSTSLVTRVLNTLYPAEEKRFPHAVYLSGDAYWGQAENVFDNDGKGSGRIIENAAKLIRENNTDLCQWRFGPRTWALLVANPNDIKFILQEKSKH